MSACPPHIQLAVTQNSNWDNPTRFKVGLFLIGNGCSPHVLMRYCRATKVVRTKKDLLAFYKSVERYAHDPVVRVRAKYFYWDMHLKALLHLNMGIHICRSLLHTCTEDTQHTQHTGPPPHTP